MEKISFDYYYGKEADQFTFFRIPKILFTDKVFKKLSVDAKVLYGILLDRMNLSMKNKWLDEKIEYLSFILLRKLQKLLAVERKKPQKYFKS